MRWLFLVLLLVATPAIAATDEQCKAAAIFFEARGESSRTQRAVLDVVENRVLAYGKTACQVVKQKGQFPWAKKGIKPVDFSTHMRYTIVSQMKRVLPEEYLYFNTIKHKGGVKTRRIGRLYFSQ